MYRNYTFDDHNKYVDVIIKDDLTTVNILDWATGLNAHGNALRFSGDEYDENIGINVAYARALSRLSRKSERYWIRQTTPVAGR